MADCGLDFCKAAFWDRIFFSFKRATLESCTVLAAASRVLRPSTYKLLPCCRASCTSFMFWSSIMAAVYPWMSFSKGIRLKSVFSFFDTVRGVPFVTTSFFVAISGSSSYYGVCMNVATLSFVSPLSVLEPGLLSFLPFFVSALCLKAGVLCAIDSGLEVFAPLTVDSYASERWVRGAF